MKMLTRICHVLERMMILLAAAAVCTVPAISIMHAQAASESSGTITLAAPDSYMQKYSESTEVFGNPLMGFAPSAENRMVEDDVQLVYIDITWRELEPEQGQYDFEAVERNNQMRRWRREGRHAVLRFLCDRPSKKSERDIPDWLYYGTKKAGQWYSISYGDGFAPDYSNPDIIEAHRKAVLAMGERWGEDSFISYIELGSLGHWGEWHVNTGEGILPLPDGEIRQEYITPWLEAFPDATLMMRRPFTPAKNFGFGLYNDMLGEPDETEKWLGWIREGGEFDQTGEPDALAAMPDSWKTAPWGGELTSTIPVRELTDESKYLDRTCRLLEECHATFVGPHTADPADRSGYEALLLSMGYRLTISQMEIRKTSPGISTAAEKPEDRAAVQASGSGFLTEFIPCVVELDWENTGAAPFYRSWPVYLAVLDEGDQVLQAAHMDPDLPSLMPGGKRHTSTELLIPSNTQEYHIAVGIFDPMTGKPSVRLASEGIQWKRGWNLLFSGSDYASGEN